MNPSAEPAPTGVPFACGRHTFDMSRPLVMGILNVTPDSFSDGGRHLHAAQAIAAAERMVDEGADIIDVGAESTRPGAAPVSEEEEWRRLAPVLTELAALGCALSVDTRHAGTMRRAVQSGVDMLNDVAGFGSAESVQALVQSSCAGCVMHMQGEPATMQTAPRYADVVQEVRAFLAQRCDALQGAGVAPNRLCIDPGFGFGKSVQHNLTLLQQLAKVHVVPHVTLVGLSRKSVIGALTRRAPAERVGGSLAAALAAVAQGAGIVRVHDVAATVDALRLWRAVYPAAPGLAGDSSSTHSYPTR